MDLVAADDAILSHLLDGRCTVGYLPDETAYPRQHIHNRLNVLVTAGYVEKRHEATGLYEL